jgi:hypothetical protein
MTDLITKARSRMSYANVTATLALFVALGGTGYAAITLPRNSVGAKQIRGGAVGASELRRGAVRSAEIRNRSIRVKDISRTARTSLRGRQGPVGPQGPAGPPAVSEHVQVNSGGGSTGTGGVTHTGGNVYTAIFRRDVSACAYSATLARVPGGDVTEPPAGRITVASGSGPNVIVNTFNAAGNPQPLPFHLIVAC